MPDTKNVAMNPAEEVLAYMEFAFLAGSRERRDKFVLEGGLGSEGRWSSRASGEAAGNSVLVALAGWRL